MATGRERRRECSATIEPPSENAATKWNFQNIALATWRKGCRLIAIWWLRKETVRGTDGANHRERVRIIVAEAGQPVHCASTFDAFEDRDQALCREWTDCNPADWWVMVARANCKLSVDV